MTDSDVQNLIIETVKLKPGITLQQLSIELSAKNICGRQSSGVAQDMVEIGLLETDDQFGLCFPK